VRYSSRLTATGSERRLARAAVLLALLLALGTGGYMAIEGWSFLDALYMTVTTITTVGFQEVHPLSSAGRVFVIVYLIFGLGVFLFAVVQVGEIVVRCKCGMRFKEYYKNPEATAEAIRGNDLYTGDLGFLDDRGHLHFSGRKKDALRVRGEMVSVEHIEHLINAHPLVAESAIVGYRPPEKERLKEDEVVAHIVLKDEFKLSALDFHEWCEKNLARFMRPKYVVFRDSLHKTATNRIQRFKVRDEGIKGATKLF